VTAVTIKTIFVVFRFRDGNFRRNEIVLWIWGGRLRSPGKENRKTVKGEDLDFDWKRGELAEGLACYRRGEFFLAHEHWETVWLQLDEPEKSFLQALIQMSSACHHRQRGNLRGAISLMRKSLRRLETCPTRFWGIEVSALCGEVRKWLRLLEDGDSTGPGTSPLISLVD
jgi:hypothetical protein